MLTALVMALGVNAAVAAAGPWLVRSLNPVSATRVIAFGSLLASVAFGYVLAVVSFGFLAQVPAIAGAGQWSSVSLAGHDPVPLVLGLAACLSVFAMLASAVRRTRAIGSELWTTACASRRLAPPGQQLVVLTEPTPDAYALPGLWRGRIVITQSMLAVLDADERRVLLAHEASHLRHRHHLYVALTEVAASANPMLRRLPPLTRLAVERWADEDAATAVADRPLVARAVARASLATHGRPDVVATKAFAITGGSALARTTALLRPAPSGRPLVLAVAMSLAVVSALGVLESSHLTETRFENAHAVFVHQ